MTTIGLNGRHHTIERPAKPKLPPPRHPGDRWPLGLCLWVICGASIALWAGIIWGANGVIG